MLNRSVRTLNRPCVFHVAIALLVVMGAVPRVLAQGLRGLVGDLMRESARLADDIPVRSVDDLVEEAGRSRALRESIEAEVRASREIPRAARETEAVLKLIRQTGPIETATLKRISELDRPAQETALAIARGGKQVAEGVPDLLARSRLVKAGGPDLLVVVGAQEAKVAKSLVHDATMLQEAIEAGKVITTTGRAATLADYARAIGRYGDATIKFWDRYVKPHWGKWLAGGALAAYLLDPEGFQDATGKLTEAGFRQLTTLVGAAAAGAIRGVGSGSGEATHDIWKAIVETFLSGTNSIYSTIGVTLIGLALLLRFRRIRHWAGRPFRWLNEVPADPADRPRKP